MITIELTEYRLKELLHYDQDTGIFTRLIQMSSNAKAGDRAGSFHVDGYLCISIDGKKYRSHRLAWFYMTGDWPTSDIDHINGVRSDNRFVNLRQATKPQNNQNCAFYKNNKSGFRGVYYSPGGRKKKWHACIRISGRTKFIGYFASREDAHAAYLAAKAKYHPFQPVPREVLIMEATL